MADLIFNTFNQKLGAKVFNLATDSLKLCLLTDAYTPDPTDAVYGDLSGEVANGNGYTTGGKALTGVTWTQDGDGAVLDAADPSWTSATFTARYGALYDDTDASKSLICLFDFGANVSVTAGTFTVGFDEDGMLVLDVAA